MDDCANETNYTADLDGAFSAYGVGEEVAEDDSQEDAREVS